MRHIDPVKEIGDAFLEVQNPARYIGREYGLTRKDDDSLYTFIMAFPDLYEIGMSNSAIKILYNGLNRKPNIRCERVFTPDTDFEELLKKKDIPLYSLESGIPIHEADVIGISIGYELGITGALSIFDTGRIPFRAADRTEDDPIVVAGGCGVTNPAPFAIFFDAIFMGEAENDFFDIFEHTADMKKAGATRAEQLAYIQSHPSVWCPGKKAVRAVQKDFGQDHTPQLFYPIANIKPVQDHGVIEIMRGCPNGCRFCHAGVYYRPQRAKQPEYILEEADRLVLEAGYREISLTSLSSGDYPEIDRLLGILTEKYRNAQISFQLPSLKVNSFTLPLLEKLSEVRKSGLTFAVETPSDAWQLSVNKEVFKEKLVEIILESKKRGWSKAKFYFMVGLPPGNDARHLEAYTNGKTEEQEIVDFLLEIQERTGIQCSVNVGTFIPKPHTAYERCRQLTQEESRAKMSYIWSHLPRGKFKVSTHNEFVSFIEGMVSRGDERVGELLIDAYNRGCRLDAWEDHMKKDVWEAVLADAGWDVATEITRERPDDEVLPWASVSMGPAPNFYRKEYMRSVKEELTPKCAQGCKTPCGICNTKHDVAVRTDVDFDHIPPELLKNDRLVLLSGENNIPILYRVIFKFRKTRGGEFLPHLATQEVFHKAILRSGLPIMYTDGFNPTPRLELAASLSLGIESNCEIASCLLRWSNVSKEEFIGKMNGALPEILQITDCIIYPITRKKKRVSLATCLWGSRYIYEFKKNSREVAGFFESETFNTCGTGIVVNSLDGTVVDITLPFACDRPFRNALEEFFSDKIQNIAHIRKEETLAKADDGTHMSYFDRFTQLAALHEPFMEKSRQEEIAMNNRNNS